MDCNHARLLLSLLQKKAELDDAEAAALQAHVDQCPECEALARCERAWDDALGRAMQSVPVPAAGKARLMNVLASRSRLRLRRTAAAASIAAALLLAVVGFGWHALHSRTDLSLEIVQEDISDRDEFVKFGVTPEQVEEQFNNRGFPTEAPRNFNYDFLKSFDIARYRNREVPKLVFARDEGGQVAMAEVYVLPDKQFDFAKLKEELENEREVRVPGSRFVAQVMQSPGGHFLFLIIFQGRQLDLFMTGPAA